MRNISDSMSLILRLFDLIESEIVRRYKKLSQNPITNKSDSLQLETSGAYKIIIL